MTHKAVMLLMLILLSWGFSQKNPFVGVWQTQVNDPYAGPILIEVIFMANGTYSFQSRSAGSLMYFPGNYRVIQNGVLRITYDQRNMYPRETCGPLGCNPIYYPDGETQNFRFVNTTTLIIQSANCPPNQCSMTLRRVK